MPKLAEALVERKGLHQKFQRLCQRLVANAKVQEGDQPDEPPGTLLQEAREILAEMKRLNIQINRTNIETKLPGSEDSISLMDAIAERDRLQQERQMLEQLWQAARLDNTQRMSYGATRNEVKWRSTIDVAEVQKQIDEVSKNYRLLDTRIQEANWLTDFIQT